MVKEEPGEIARIYKALGHPYRKRIIEIIGGEGKSSFTELRDNLKISVGALYHHIDTLGDLITKDDQHKYILTERGKLAYEFLKSGGEQLSSISLAALQKPKGAWTNFLAGFQRAFPLRRLFLRISAKPFQYLPITATIIALGAWIAARAGLEFTLIFPDSQTIVSSTLIATYFVVSWLILFGLCDLLATFLFKRRGGNLSLLVGSSFSLLPLILFSGLWYLMKIFGLSLIQTAVPVLLILFQALTIGIMSAAISLSKGVRTEKAALVSFIVTYINIAYILFRSSYQK
jgi:DNA-binding transcriptional ArsR family regulator